MKSQKLRVKRNTWTHETYCTFLIYFATAILLADPPTLADGSAMTKDGEKKQKSLFLSFAIIIIIITDPAAVEAGVWSWIPGELVLLITAGWW